MELPEFAMHGAKTGATQSHDFSEVEPLVRAREEQTKDMLARFTEKEIS
jgi:hypothetical protein